MNCRFCNEPITNGRMVYCSSQCAQDDARSFTPKPESAVSGNSFGIRRAQNTAASRKDGLKFDYASDISRTGDCGPLDGRGA